MKVDLKFLRQKAIECPELPITSMEEFQRFNDFHCSATPKVVISLIDTIVRSSMGTRELDQRCQMLEEMLTRAEKYLKEGQAKFAPNVTNSLVHDLLADIERRSSKLGS
jgi:hypothetical protein